MQNHWQLQQAKNHFSEVVNKAVHHGPQVVTRHGVETVVVLSKADYQKLQAPKDNLVDFFHNSPLRGVSLDLTRSKDTGREIEF